MDLWLLKPGHKVRTHDGAEAEILSPTEDGEWIRIKYLEAKDSPSLVGTEDLVSVAEVEALIGKTRRREWSETVTVMLHRIPESDDYEGGYEAETMAGVPNNVRISGSDSDSKEAALDHLVDGLALLRFSGRVDVEDATEPGPMERYEVDVHAQG